MLSSTFSALFAVAISTASAQSQSVCQASPYRALTCLASNTRAADACSSRLPTVTATFTTTTSVLSVSTTPTIAPSVDKQQQITVSITSYETSTVTETCTETPTSYSPVVATSCVSSTITTYVDPTPTARREKRQLASMACAMAGLEKLSHMDNGTLADACSCIGNAPATTTVTKYVTSLIGTTTTSFAGIAPTTTAYFIDRVTCTETETASPVVIPVSTTTTITETSTVSLAAPTFNPVYGPKSGCADTSVGKAQVLAASITDSEKAVSMCKDICKQEPSCSFLYVQQMFTDYGSASPYYECYMNEKELDESNDLQCGKKVGIFGNATGYDACNRGTVSASE